MGDTHDDVGAVIGGLAPDLGIVAVRAHDGGDAAALGAGGDGTFPAGIVALGGDPRVHLAVLMDHLALVVDHNGAVAGGVVALQLEDDTEDAPDLQPGAGVLQPLDFGGIEGEHHLQPLQRVHSLYAEFRRNKQIVPGEAAGADLHVLNDLIDVFVDLLHAGGMDRLQLCHDGGHHFGLGRSAADTVAAADDHSNYLLFISETV